MPRPKRRPIHAIRAHHHHRRALSQHRLTQPGSHHRASASLGRSCHGNHAAHPSSQARLTVARRRSAGGIRSQRSAVSPSECTRAAGTGRRQAGISRRRGSEQPPAAASTTAAGTVTAAVAAVATAAAAAAAAAVATAAAAATTTTAIAATATAPELRCGLRGVATGTQAHTTCGPPSIGARGTRERRPQQQH